MKAKIANYINNWNLKHIAILFLLIGFLVYGNALTNNFIEDDKSYIINNPSLHNINIAQSLGPNQFNYAGQYRPIPAIYFSIVYGLAGNVPFFYHVIQILLHAICAVLLYIIFRKFLSKAISFFLSIIFLIHPINVESVSYIAQTVNPLFFFFGAIAFLILTDNTVSIRRFLFAFLLLLLSILTKETGILFLVLTLIYCFLFYRNRVIQFSFGALIIITVYLLLRFFVGHVGLSSRPLIPIADLSFFERLFNIPTIIFYYLKTFFYPKTLDFMQLWIITPKDISIFYFSTFIDTLFFILFGYAFVFIYQKGRNYIKPFLFFFLWFLFGLLMHLQLFPLDLTVADRWFYFPIVGLLGTLGVCYQALVKKTSTYQTITLCFAIIIISILSFRTILRNNDWQNSIKLYNHDIQIHDNFMIENSLGSEYETVNDYGDALKHIQRSVALRPNEANLSNLGILFQTKDDIKNAEYYYQQALYATNYNLFLPHKHNITTYVNYATLLVVYDKSLSSVSFIKNALDDYPDDPNLLLLLTLANYQLGNTQEALGTATKIYQEDPTEKNASIYMSIKSNQPLTLRLNGKIFIFKHQ